MHVSLRAAIYILLGDRAQAILVLQDFFNGAFLSSIAHTGEQPFEAFMDRPQHHRASNIAALITNAKLGDQLGLDFWTAQTRYGATIQTAVDFAMKHESIELTESVATVASVFGDPSGKYAAYLKRNTRSGNFDRQPMAYLATIGAMTSAPALVGRGVGRRTVVPQVARRAPAGTECPPLFVATPVVEIDDGVSVTCELVRKYYA